MTPNIRTQISQPRAEFPVRSFFLYGEPKVGKTTAAAQFPQALILNVTSENGTTEIVGDVIDVTTPDNLTEVCRWLRAGGHAYKSIVLDGLSAFVLDEISRHKSKDSRRSFKEAGKELTPALHEFLSLPMIRVITGHARRDEEEIKGDDGRTVVKVSVYPDLPPRVRLFVEGRVDAFGYCFSQNGGPKVWWTPLDVDKPRPRAIAAGNRLGLPRLTELSFNSISAALVSQEKPSAESDAQPSPSASE